MHMFRNKMNLKVLPKRSLIRVQKPVTASYGRALIWFECDSNESYLVRKQSPIRVQRQLLSVLGTDPKTAAKEPHQKLCEPLRSLKF